MAADICNICSAFLGCSKRKATEVAGPLEALLPQANFKLLEDFLICDSCLIKVQSACTFKASYLENSQKLHIKQEDIENETVCEICRESVKTVDCIPLFHSVTESDKLNIFRFLSFELELKNQDNPLTCELCHKSILNFCIVTKPLSLVIKNEISNDTIIVSDLKSKNLSSAQNITVTSLDSANDCTFNIKKEDVEVTEDHGLSTTYDDFLCKNEEIDLKMEDDRTWSHDRQEDGKFKCLICNYQTERKINLDQHIKRKHNSNEIETFRCQICDFQTRNKYYIKKHLKTVHNIIEMFKCHICDYQTQDQPHLRRHIRVHEVFSCHNCDYRTKYKKHLEQHLLVHKSSNEIEMFKCHICEFQTKYKRHLKLHLILHKNCNEIEMFKCPSCDYQTKIKNTLKAHLIIHKNPNEIEIFKCGICEFQTRYKGTLKKHLMVHKNSNEIEMFKCQSCDFQTKYKNYLKIHLNAHKRC